jgi:hypothetical protein
LQKDSKLVDQPTADPGQAESGAASDDAGAAARREALPDGEEGSGPQNPDSVCGKDASQSSGKADGGNVDGGSKEPGSELFLQNLFQGLDGRSAASKPSESTAQSFEVASGDAPTGGKRNEQAETARQSTSASGVEA